MANYATGPGWCWVGEGTAYKDSAKQLRCTLVVVWGRGQKEPWLLLTDLAPEDVDGSWYGLRVWIELGFRALKSFGWHWERTRRTNPVRIARHWLVLAIATLLSLAVGTRLEEAAIRARPPGKLRRPRRPPPARPRRRSVFTLGRDELHRLVLAGKRWWRALWLLPEQLPTLAPDITLIQHVAPQGGANA
jgi:hypothetical protein